MISVRYLRMLWKPIGPINRGIPVLFFRSLKL